MYTKLMLGLMIHEDLVKIAVRQNERIDEIRGYASGATPDLLNDLDDKTLISCILKTQKDWGF